MPMRSGTTPLMSVEDELPVASLIVHLPLVYVSHAGYEYAPALSCLANSRAFLMASMSDFRLESRLLAWLSV